MKYLLGIDEGGSGYKAVLFTTEGKQVASAYREIPSYYPHPGWVIQKIDEIRESVYAACRECIESSGVDPHDILGVSQSSQGITMVFLDENEEPVFDFTVHWQDLRHVEKLDEWRKNIDEDEYFRVSGMEFGTYNNAVMLWLQENEPEAWSRVRHICSHQDYLLRQYGADGFYIDEGSSNFMGMAAAGTGDWDKRLMDVYNVDESMLAEVNHYPGKIIGHVTKEASEKMGLPVGCNVCAGIVDTNCCTAGAGGKDAGTQILIMGTGGVSIMVTDEYKLDPKGRLALRTNPGFGNYHYYLMANTGASAFRWFRDAMSDMEMATGRLMGVDSYDLITKIAGTVPPGSNGVTALTCIQGCHTRIKNENARGSFFGINLGTSKADMARSVLEGICFEMKDIHLMNEELVGKINVVRLCGGVAKSEMWCQMFADIFEKPIETLEVSELGCFGAAMCVGVGTGVFKDLADAVSKCTRVKETYYPNPDTRDAYRKAYERWRFLYDIANKEIY